MNVLILGGGEIGRKVAKTLLDRNNNVSIVDNSQITYNLLSEKLDIKPVLGNACDINVLKEADIETSDIIIAVTSSDETNITSCQIADTIFNVKTKIARISQTSYNDAKQIMKKAKFPIDFFVYPEYEIVKTIRRIIDIPNAIEVIPLPKNLRLVRVLCNKNAPITDAQIKYVQFIDTTSNFVIGAIKRENQYIIPQLTEQIHYGDEVYYVCLKENIQHSMSMFGYSIEEKLNIIFIGIGNICKSAIHLLKSDNVSIKVIEKDLNKALLLSETFHDIEIISGEPLDTKLLESINITNTDLIVSSDNDDKLNIISCLLAKRLGAKHVVAVINDSAYADVLYSFGVNSVIDSKKLVAEKILNYIHYAESIENISSFGNADIELLSVKILENSNAIGLLTDEIIIKNEFSILAIIRNDECILQTQNAIIITGDQIICIAKKNCITKILNIFKEKPAYLV